MRTQATPPQDGLALWWRRANQQLQLYVKQEGNRGPWADFWHLPPLGRPDPLPDGAMPAGTHTRAGFCPGAQPVQVWALEEHRAQGATAPQGGLWLSVADLHAGHASGVMLLSPPLWATVRALLDRPPQALQKLQHELVPGDGAAPQDVTELAPGIAAMPLLTPTLPPSTHTNCYLLGRKHVTVVDPGTPYPSEQQAFMQLLRQRTQQGARIEAIWISHFHEDHIGAAMRVHQEFGAPICAHADTARALAGRVAVHRLVADGEALQVEDVTFDALHTPGHAHGHLSFWCRKGGHLLSGDNVLGTGTPIVPPAPNGSMDHYMASLTRLASLSLGLLLPGHGPPCARAGRRVQETLQARHAREALLLEVLESFAHGATLDDLVGKVYRGLGHALRGLAELSTLAHLEKLCAEHKLVRLADQHAARWRLARAPHRRRRL